MKTLATIGTLLLALEPPFTSDLDLWRYVITQGGLLVVVLILLWGIRAQLKGKDERLAVMTDLVREATAAQTQSADAVHRMARAVEILTERRVHRP